jgi:cysteine desulfurase
MNEAEKRAVYLDYAATTPVDSEVARSMAECLTFDGVFGNPGSHGHAYGEAARARLESARAELAAAVGAAPSEVVFTSGATEANNLALLGVAQHYARKGRHIVTARTEHKAVLDPCKQLQQRGWDITLLAPAADGRVSAAAVASALRPDTVLVSLMHVNNEIGAIQDIAAVGAICSRHGAFLHVDAAQSFGKLVIDFGSSGVDLMSLSAHKAYGPKGVGALLVSARRGVQLDPIVFGGGQERGLRAGTVATHQAVGMAVACRIAAACTAEDAARAKAFNDRLWDGIGQLPGVFRNGAVESCVPHILNVSFSGVGGESLVQDVRAGIAVSTGSACMSATREASYVLRALGRDDQLAEASLRFGFGRQSTMLGVDRAIDCVRTAVLRLRRIAAYEDSQ